MSYAVSGKIAGFASRRMPGWLHGLGDAAYDSALQAYNSAHAQWVLDKQGYDRAYAAWQTQTAATQAAYNRALYDFQTDLARWQAESSAYTNQRAASENQARTNAMTYGISQNGVLAQFPSIVIPAGYAGCVTQAQRDAWAKTCQFQSVKGLGGPAPTGPECGLALLPVCAQPIPMPAPLRARPAPPVEPPAPLAPAPIGPEPMPPPVPAPPPPAVVPVTTQPTPPPPSVLNPTYTDSLVPTTGAGTPVKKPSTASAGLLSNGLLLVVLAGGGYALYRTFKKPKKAA